MLYYNVFIYNLTFFLNNTTPPVSSIMNIDFFPSSYRIHSCFTPNSPSEKERSKTSHTNHRFAGVLFSRRFDCSFVHAKRPLNHFSGLSEEILIQQLS